METQQFHNTLVRIVERNLGLGCLWGKRCIYVINVEILSNGQLQRQVFYALVVEHGIGNYLLKNESIHNFCSEHMDRLPISSLLLY